GRSAHADADRRAGRGIPCVRDARRARVGAARGWAQPSGLGTGGEELSVDIELNEEQTAFRATVRSFVERSIKPVARDLEHSGRYPTEIVDEMKRMGLFGMLVP